MIEKNKDLRYQIKLLQHSYALVRSITLRNEIKELVQISDLERLQKELHNVSVHFY